MADAATARQTEVSPPEVSADWTRVQRLACELTVDLPLPGVRVRDLMQMEPGWVIDSHWQVSADIPLRVNGELVAWSEFEVVADRMAVRLTDLA